MQCDLCKHALHGRDRVKLEEIDVEEAHENSYHQDYENFWPLTNDHQCLKDSIDKMI